AARADACRGGGARTARRARRRRAAQRGGAAGRGRAAADAGRSARDRPAAGARRRARRLRVLRRDRLAPGRRRRRRRVVRSRSGAAVRRAAGGLSVAARSFAGRLRTGIAVLAAAPLVVAVVAAAAWLLARNASETAFETVGIALLVAAAVLAVAGAMYGRRLAASVSAPVARIQSTLESLSDGDLDARVRWEGRDEFAGLADARDRLLDERVASLNRTIRDSEELNTSVIEIMKAVGTIATTKDLSVRVPVTENVTGAIADALNLLTDEMARVLENVSRLANDVAQATFALRGQSDLAITAAAREQREVGMAASELSQAAQALVAVAQRAHQVDQSAGRALVETGEAVRVVGGTIEGIVQ